ncbi:helix-turn-helix transcriptional regulator [Streptomyces mirabilis]|uniref:helix-turn-helix transcriptional regulator n=1 Tax=Streptomyces mirabilis TaxID=68239 RepID=UPI00332BA3DA
MISEAIKQLRTERQMTQRQLARALDVGELAISRWERGINQPTVTNIQRLAGTFEVPITVLFGDTSSV